MILFPAVLFYLVTLNMAANLLKLSKQSVQTAVSAARLPRQYAMVNTKRPRSYWDYESMKDSDLTWSPPYDYEVQQKIGRGKYSDVFLAYNTRNEQRCCIKMLKPVKSKKIYREIKVLQNLSGDNNNIVQLLDTIRDPISKTPSLIFEYVEPSDWKQLNETLTEKEWIYYVSKHLQTIAGLDLLFLSALSSDTLLPFQWDHASRCQAT